MSQHDDKIPRPPAGRSPAALNRRAFVGLAGTAGAALATGCGTTGLKSSASSSAGTIRIGYIIPPDFATFWKQAVGIDRSLISGVRTAA